jgi:hypothetical protein
MLYSRGAGKGSRGGQWGVLKIRRSRRGWRRAGRVGALDSQPRRAQTPAENDCAIWDRGRLARSLQRAGSRRPRRGDRDLPTNSFGETKTMLYCGLTGASIPSTNRRAVIVSAGAARYELGGRSQGWTASSSRRLATTKLADVDMEIPKTGFPNFFACKALIFPNRAKKIFAKIWSAKSLADRNPWMHPQAPSENKLGLLGLRAFRPLWPRRPSVQKARKRVDSTIRGRRLSVSATPAPPAPAIGIGNRKGRQFSAAPCEPHDRLAW